MEEEQYITLKKLGLSSRCDSEHLIKLYGDALRNCQKQSPE